MTNDSSLWMDETSTAWMEGLFINSAMNVVIPAAAIYSLFFNLKGRRIAWWRTVLISWLMSQVGISMGYHRLFTHKTYDTSQPLTWALASFGLLAMQGTPMFWGAQHRIHHKFCEDPQDPHSPIQHGFWHAHGGFLNGYTQSTVDNNRNFDTICMDMLRDPEQNAIHRNEKILAVAIWAGVPAVSYALFGVHATLWYLHVPQVLSWHAAMSVNSAMHTFGYMQPGDEANHCRARNVPWLWGLSLGEAWHANHHGEVAASFEGRWWEFDPVWRTIQLFERVGLVWNVKRRSQEPVQAEFPGLPCMLQMIGPPMLALSSLLLISRRKPRDKEDDIELAEMREMGKLD